MEVRNCRNCKRLFNYIAGVQICPACKDELEKKFQKAKEFIRETKDATIKMVAEEVDVSENQIREWIKDERLIFTSTSASEIVCEVCGTTIPTGRYCDKCKAQMVNTLNGAIKKPEAPVKKIIKDGGPKMRFLDNR